MATRIVLLRAVNVGPATLPMAQLRELAAELGATSPRTYIASGNLVCDVDGDAAAFDRRLRAGIERRFGFDRDVISRSPDEVSAALADHPFEVVESRFSYVTFLTAGPTEAALEKARSYPTYDDAWQVIGREMHIRYAHGAGRPEMNSDAVGRALGVPGTARNLNTVAKLIALAEA